jgi:Kef-type K+ transport system membrane component KefB
MKNATDFFSQLIEEFQLPLQNPILVFSLILFIILLSPILLKKLNIPGIIGLIISGVIIGPNGLNILAKTDAIQLFSTIGLLYIMFIAGLELDMNEFKANRNKSLLFGFYTFIIPLSIGFPVCFYILGYGYNASFLTASMFATHTLVAYPIVSKLGISKNKTVAVAVGGTILTDTAVLIILAIVLGNSQGNLNQEFWLRLFISLAIFSGIMFIIIPRIAKWFFRRLESEKHSHYIFVLSMVFFAAFLAEVAGVEPIIGAFVAGLALNKLIPHSSPLMNRIEFIGNSLFIPFFLISVGMLVNLRVLFNGPTALIVAGTLTLVALFGKWMAALFTQITFRYTSAQRQLIFGLSSAHAAATLAIILVGYNAGILDENILNGTIILILITCIVASFVTEKASRKIMLETDDYSTDLLKLNSLKEEHILLPITAPNHLEKLLEFCIFIRYSKSANPISILSVVLNDQEAELNLRRARVSLESVVKQASASENKVNIIATIDLHATKGISRISKEIMASLIVVDWNQRAQLTDKFLAEKDDSLLSNTSKTLIIGHFEKAFVSHQRVCVFAPIYAERENGFELWFLKIDKLAHELSIPVALYSNETTVNAVQNLIKRAKLNTNLKVTIFDNWTHFDHIKEHVLANDILTVILAYKGSPSYINEFEDIPNQLEEFFYHHNKMIIYPEEYSHEYHGESYDDFTAEPLSKGIEKIQKIGKEIGNIFKQSE